MKDWILHHLGNEHDRATIMTLISFAMNAIFCIAKLVLGVYLHSAWLGYSFLKDATVYCGHMVYFVASVAFARWGSRSMA